VSFVPDDFVPPVRLASAHFVLEPLAPEHNESDYAAWSSSRKHIHGTPGWEDSKWPDERDKQANLRDLERHAEDFRNRRGFTYTVLDPGDGEVIGCVYIYPSKAAEHDARVLSWVSADRAELDAPLWRAVSRWLADEWPFGRVDYAPR
jgi:RimJ/RimL family protein N-acetyltransferase